MAVVGLGITGRAVVEALQRRSIDVVAFDDRPSDDTQRWAAQLDLAIEAPTAVDLPSRLRGVDGVLPAPGLPERHPIFAAAIEAGLPVMSEFDLASAWDDRPCVAITGTDGKTTVVTLVQRMLAASGIAAMAVGNTDTPYVEAIDDPSTEIFVVEASSFRLGHSQHFSPRVATWLNFGPDHLDAHTDLASYEAAKASIWRHLESESVAIGNRDDPVVHRHLCKVDGAHIETFGAAAAPTSKDHGVVAGALIVAGEELLRVDDLSRSLPHDVMNALAAAASARHLGADRDATVSVLHSFDGLPHRVEVVGEIGGVRYVNDSKATTPHAAAAAIGGFDSVVLLAGGKNKGLAFDAMVELASHISHVVAIGEAAADVEAAFDGRVPTTVATSMEEAVEDASRRAKPGGVILLSPACASYDWYGSYAERGEDFARIVAARLAGGADS